MATATKSKSTLTPALVTKWQDTFGPDGWLAQYNVEREEQLELLGLSYIAGLDPLFLGTWGVGKTWMIESSLMCIDTGVLDSELFNTMVFKESPADDVLGPRSLPAMKEGRIERHTEGFLPTAVVAYIDEFFKASPTLLNSLLDIMANRFVKIGKNKLAVPLQCLVASSNELPEREDLQPVRDRFGITNLVEPVKSAEGIMRVMRIQDQYQRDAQNIDTSDAPQITLEDFAQIRQEVLNIELPDAIFENMVTAHERWSQHGFAPSMRRGGQMLKAIKARAWARGDQEAKSDDMTICAHMAWNHPADREKAREVVLEFANVYARAANKMKLTLEPVLKELDEVKKNIAEAGEVTSEHDQKGFTVIRQLKEIIKDAKVTAGKAKAAGHDSRDLEAVIDDAQKARKHMADAIGGLEDD